MYRDLPSKTKVGGQEIKVQKVDRVDDGCLGHCKLASGLIEIAEKYNRDEVVPHLVQLNTFYHELTHAILGTMGYSELNNDERFVCTFSSFLTEALTSTEYKKQA